MNNKDILFFTYERGFSPTQECSFAVAIIDLIITYYLSINNPTLYKDSFESMYL